MTGTLTGKDVTPDMKAGMLYPLYKRMRTVQYEHYLYWILERMMVYYKRRKGESPPWTRDIIMANNFFTTPFRELDKTTAYYRDRIREPICTLPTRMGRDKILFATVAFRWFNLPATGDVLLGANPYNRNLLVNWDFDRAIQIFKPLVEDGTKLFTSGYIIKLANATPKYKSVCDQLEHWHQNRYEHLSAIKQCTTLQAAHAYISKIKHLGKFMAYEIICDLMYTHILDKATDQQSWCSPGPGCIRGLLRMKGIDFSNFARNAIRVNPEVTLDDCRYLLSRVPDDLNAILSGRKRIRFPAGVMNPPYTSKFYNPHRFKLASGLTKFRSDGFPDGDPELMYPTQRMDMRFIEHTLCEFDKYERLYYQDGKSKRTYKPISPHEKAEADPYSAYSG